MFVHVFLLLIILASCYTFPLLLQNDCLKFVAFICIQVIIEKLYSTKGTCLAFHKRVFVVEIYGFRVKLKNERG